MFELSVFQKLLMSELKVSMLTFQFIDLRNYKFPTFPTLVSSLLFVRNYQLAK